MFKNVNWEVLWEGIKEPLREIVLVVVTFILDYILSLNSVQSKVSIYLALRSIDSILHEYGKTVSTKKEQSGVTKVLTTIDKYNPLSI